MCYKTSSPSKRKKKETRSFSSLSSSQILICIIIQYFSSLQNIIIFAVLVGIFILEVPRSFLQKADEITKEHFLVRSSTVGSIKKAGGKRLKK